MRKLKNSELNRITIHEFKNTDKIPFVVILDNIRSLNNIGSVFRTGDALLITEICLCGFTACPPHNEIHKTALGATDSVNWRYFESSLEAVEKLRNEGYTIASVEQCESSVMLDQYEIQRNSKYALVFGNEVHGVDQEVVNQSDVCIEIPQFGTKHSLNISVSVGIVLWDLINKWKSAQ